MGTAELFILAVGLSMDAFAVSVCKGLSMRKVDKKYHHVCLFSGWSEDRKSVWCAVSIESRVVRRCDLDPDRSENAGRGAGEYLNIES